MKNIIVGLGLMLFGLNMIGQADTLTKISWYKYGQRLPMDAKWVNNTRSINTVMDDDKLYLLNFYSPSELGSSSITEKFVRLAKKYTQIQLINVLVPKHEAEKDSLNIREHLYREQNDYPVLLTDSLEVFNDKLGHVTASTGAVLLNHARVMMRYEAASDYVNLESHIDSFITQVAIPFKLNRLGRTLESEITKVPKPVIGFPSALVASSREARMYVSDLQQHRIVALESDGQVNEVIGSGLRGCQDGRFAIAKFNMPMGLALDERNRLLYVADTENHAIRLVNLNTGEVSTILGNGSAATQSTGQVVGTTAPISYPTGLALGAGKLYIAMSGFNQVWEMDLANSKAVAIAGSGKPESADGKGLRADLNEPVSISFDKDGILYILEAISGDVRTLNLDGEVTTVFDNSESKVKLQNPRSILVTEDGIFISDSYNNQLKQLIKGEAIALTGLPVAGWADGKPGKAMMNEPHGLAYVDGMLHIADMGNSLIRTFTSKKSKLGTTKLTKLGPLEKYEEAITKGRKVNLGPVKIGDGTNKVSLFIEGGDDFSLLLYGRNECDISDERGNNKVAVDRVASGEVVFDCQGSEENQYVLAELYVTFKDRLKDEAIYYMPVTLLIEFDYDPGSANNGSAIFNLSEYVEGKY